MIVLGGSSMHKGAQGWHAARAIGCLPGLTGNVGAPGAGFGPRHGGNTHGQALASIVPPRRGMNGPELPNQMSRMTEALNARDVRVMLLFGTDMLSSFADSRALATGLDAADLVVSYDLFLNDTARRCADVVLPATSWLEELGCKSTNTHLYLMPPALDPPGETRPLGAIVRALASRLDVPDALPWSDEGIIDTILDHPSTRHATVATLRGEGGVRPLDVSHVAHPDLVFPTPSGKIEFVSARAAALGLPALPESPDVESSAHPLVLRQGRTLAHFHGFYDHGRALPSLAVLEPEPTLWMSPADAGARGIRDGDAIRCHNDRGEMRARAHVPDGIPAGTVWMRDGWTGLNDLTSGAPIVPDAAVDIFPFSAGQASFDARIDVVRV
jgi:anaerobic selenocysteine-containing dehydrogenase